MINQHFRECLFPSLKKKKTNKKKEKEKIGSFFVIRSSYILLFQWTDVEKRNAFLWALSRPTK